MDKAASRIRLLVINAFLAQNSIFGYENHIFILSLFSEKK